MDRFAGGGALAFGWSFPKVMIVVALGVLLFWVPLMTWLVILKERRKRRAPRR